MKKESTWHNKGVPIHKITGHQLAWFCRQTNHEYHRYTCTRTENWEHLTKECHWLDIVQCILAYTLLTNNNCSCVFGVWLALMALSHHWSKSHKLVRITQHRGSLHSISSATGNTPPAVLALITTAYYVARLIFLNLLSCTLLLSTFLFLVVPLQHYLNMYRCFDQLRQAKGLNLMTINARSLEKKMRR